MIRVRTFVVDGKTPGLLRYGVERLADSLTFDFQAQAFAASVSPTNATAPMTADAAPFAGRWRADLDAPVEQFPDGCYLITVVDGDTTVGLMQTMLRDGDDAISPKVSPMATLQFPVVIQAPP